MALPDQPCSTIPRPPPTPWTPVPDSTAPYSLREGEGDMMLLYGHISNALFVTV
ncbi:MAG: hypothetical protein GY820_06365 [Gammaproteobacteria bacterium]|nr:hypothetical protein [Gammaproteobacteria bacterium]